MIEVKERIRELLIKGSVIAIGLTILNVLLWIFVPFGFVLGIILSLGTIGITAWWIWRGIYTVGTETPPRMALRLRLGKAIDAAESGLYFRFWPVDRIVRFWTTPYTLSFVVPDVYSRHDPPEFATQSMTVHVTFVFSWPRPGVEYDTGQKDDADVSIMAWGQDLLNIARRALPFNPETVTVDQLGLYLVGGIADAVTNIMAKYNHQECRQGRERIEDETKGYLVKEVGNVVRGLRIPPERMDIQITRIEMQEDIQVAIRGVEIAFRQGEQTKIRAAADAEAAPNIASALRERLQAYVDRGVASDIAAFADRGVAGGEPLSLEGMRDLFITRALGGVTGGQGVLALTADGFASWFGALGQGERDVIGAYVRSQQVAGAQ